MIYGSLGTALLADIRQGATPQHRDPQLLIESGSVGALTRPARPRDRSVRSSEPSPFSKPAARCSVRLVLENNQHAAGLLERGHRATRSVVHMYTRRWRQLRLEVGTGPIELAVTDDNTTKVKDRALVLLDCRPAVARDLPGNALGDEPRGAGSLRSGEKVARSLASHPRVASTMFGNVHPIVRQVGELVHNHLGPEARNRFTERSEVKRVADDRLGTHCCQPLSLRGGAGHTSDIMPGGDQQRHQAHTDHPSRTSHEDSHPPMLTADRAQPIEQGEGTAAVRLLTRQGCLRRSARCVRQAR